MVNAKYGTRWSDELRLRDYDELSHREFDVAESSHGTSAYARDAPGVECCEECVVS